MKRYLLILWESFFQAEGLQVSLVSLGQLVTGQVWQIHHVQEMEIEPLESLRVALAE